ncbi:MAG TPA: hypothetical protein ENF73_01540 [Proteobacteria bacterium]|nr:hypothetical protein [Pseudomonadota bacterium]
MRHIVKLVLWTLLPAAIFLVLQLIVARDKVFRFGDVRFVLQLIYILGSNLLFFMIAALISTAVSVLFLPFGSRVRELVARAVYALACGAFLFFAAVSVRMFAETGHLLNKIDLEMFLQNANQIFFFTLRERPVEMPLLLVSSVLTLAAVYIYSGRVRLTSGSKRQELVVLAFLLLCLASPVLKVLDIFGIRTLTYPLSETAPLVMLQKMVSSNIAYELVQIPQDELERLLTPKMRLNEYLARLKVKRRPHIFLIVIESLTDEFIETERQGKPVMPFLSRFRGRCLNFTRAYSPSPFSALAEPAIYLSLYPMQQLEMLSNSTGDEGLPLEYSHPYLQQVLHELGYTTAVFSSQNENWGRMIRWTKTPYVDYFFHSLNMDGVKVGTGGERKLLDEYTVKHALDWIDNTWDKSSPIFLLLNFQRSHFPYWTPPPWDSYFTPSKIDFPFSYINYPEDKVEIVKNVFFNALHYVDYHLGVFLKGLQDRGMLDDSIVIITGDNGESFYEHGHPAHGLSLYESQVHIALMFCAPGLIEPGRFEHLVSHVDVLPTLMGILGVDPYPCWQGIDVLNTPREQLDHRPVFFYTPLFQPQVGIVRGELKYTLNLGTLQAELYNVRLDPKEQNPLDPNSPEAKELAAILDSFINAHVSYYHTILDRRSTFFWKGYFNDGLELMKRYCPPRIERLIQTAQNR